MIPVPGWAAFVQGGASKQMIEWMPVDMVEQVLKGCIELRKQLIEDVYQITGISDILRGQSEASETATAQNIKAQWGSIRIRDRQAELARFCRDITQISAEIIAEKFQPETIWRITGLQFPTNADKQQIQAAQQQQAMQAQQQAQMAAQQAASPDPQTGGASPLPPSVAAPSPMPAQPPAQLPPDADKTMQKPTQEDIIALMRDDCLRNYRVDIETDSTIEADEQAEKTSRNEFLTAMATFLTEAIPISQASPELIPMLGEALIFTVRGYRAGYQLEDAVQQAVDEMTEKGKAAAQQGPPPDPALELEKQKFQVDQQDKAARLQMDQQATQAKTATDQQVAASKIQTDQQEAQTKMQATMAKSNLDALNASRQHSIAVAAHNQQMLDQAQQDEQDNTEAGAEGKPQAPSLLDPLGNILKGQAELKKAMEGNTAALAQAMQALAQAMAQQAAAMSRPKTVSLIRGVDGRAAGAVLTPSSPTIN
jgi:hypothetical protein